MIYSFIRESFSPSQSLKYIMTNRKIYIEEIRQTHTAIKQDWVFQNQIQRASHESQGHESLFYALW